MDFFLALARGFTSGDAIWMWAILAAQIVSMAIIIERVVALFINRKVNQKTLSKSLADDIRAGNLDKALRRSQQIGKTEPLGVVASAGIQAAIDMGGKEEIQLKMDEVLLEETSRVEKRIGFLAMFANVATLLGLLGTITGLIHSFAGISNANAAQKATILSQGISLAMNTTAYGLIVAVPALIMYAVLQNRASRLSDDLNKAALNLFIQLGFHYTPVSDKKQK
ncbi:MAG: MotA/TolQ/ExbB proton channel family protein [Bdellovibrionaceae bacterium]|nr:MotA/TolQ/ExbB proton channel family protein [Pseudobdellovibrionaceae bacterium]